ncbi:MAG: alpha/beta hydrolase [Cyanobacteria bacterium P01_H01_bin.15]
MLLHGLADHGGVWGDLVDSLSSSQQWIVPDLRGHGESSKPNQPSLYTADQLANDLAALSQHLNLRSQTVVAHSWAAKVALIWARKQPEQVRRLILVDPYFVNKLPRLLQPTLPLIYRVLPFLKVMGPFSDFESATKIARTLKQYRGWTPLQAEVFRDSLIQTEDGQWRSKFSPAARDGVFLDVLNTAGLTESLSTPTDLLMPENGLNRASWQLKPYQKYLSQLTIQAIPGNHWPHLVEPAAFQLAIANCLD